MSNYDHFDLYRRPTRMRIPDDLRMRIGQLASKLPIYVVAEICQIAEATVRKCQAEYGIEIDAHPIAEVKAEAEQLRQDMEAWHRAGKSSQPFWIVEMIRNAKAARTRMQ
jgi:hypothetical protein